jgi:hypothetical protein
MSLALRACMATALAWVVACSSAAPPRPKVAASAPKSRTLYRPEWVGALAADVDIIARCLEGRESPAFVVHVHHTDDAVTVVTTVDAGVALEACAVADGRVLLREPSAEHLADFDGQPLFSLGPRKPRLRTGARVQEVVRDEAVIGWLCWPESANGRDRNRASKRAAANQGTRRQGT